MNLQQVIMRLNEYWAEQGCIIWHPHNVQVGAGTANPATVLRVLGPEPWNVAYLEPSARPADGRYGDNPNRWYEYYQYQVILKPDPGHHIELYLKSLEALGIDLDQHDIRFVEDNWQSPSLGAWGLGWEVWLDGMEITQYTYFQQACGVDLNPASVEITYGVERIVMLLQGVESISQIKWLGDITYGDLHLTDELDYCKYNFNHADIKTLQAMYVLCEEEAKNAITHNLVLPAHDYLLRCSHLFNVLDARGAVGVTQRSHYFARMRELARQVATIYLVQREDMGFPLATKASARIRRPAIIRQHEPSDVVNKRADFLFEIGVEELPPQDLNLAIQQLEILVPKYFHDARLHYQRLHVTGTPRRLVILVEELSSSQRDAVQVIKGPLRELAFDPAGKTTKAAEGFARSMGLSVDQLTVSDFDGTAYVTATKTNKGRAAPEILKQIMPKLIAEVRFPLAMHWNETRVMFSRPIRWIVALLGNDLVDIEYAGVLSDRITHGSRPMGAKELRISSVQDYFRLVKENGIVLDVEERRAIIRQQVDALAVKLGGHVQSDITLLNEVANLVEQPVAIAGSFDPAFLNLPPEVLITVMKKHQRYFPVMAEDRLLPYFITVTNGRAEVANTVRKGSEEVLRARFADASFFYEADTAQPLSAFVEKLENLTFQEQLGSYLSKTERLKVLAPVLAAQLNLSSEEQDLVQRTAELAKADLATRMVVELTSLQGIMGSYYAVRSGEDARVAVGIKEHYLPRFAGDELPIGWVGTVVGLADRLDSLVGLFAVDLAPTSTNDPHGLRRAALGLVQILMEKGVSLSLSRAIREASMLLPISRTEDVITEVSRFIRRRLQVWLLDQGFRHDLIEAVLAIQSDDLASAYQAIRDLQPWTERPEFGQLLKAYNRSARIVQTYEEEFYLNGDLLTEPAANSLFHAYLVAKQEIETRLNVDSILTTMLTLVQPINDFFANILVMHEDGLIREARLALLQRIVQLPRAVLDLTKIKSPE